MTVTGRSPPSRWSCSSTLGAWRTISSGTTVASVRRRYGARSAPAHVSIRDDRMPHISRQGEQLHRVGHPRDDPPVRIAHGADQPGPGLSRLPGAGRDQGGRRAGDRATDDQPVRDHVGRDGRSARPSRPRPALDLPAGRSTPSARSRSPAARPRAMIASMLAILDPGDEMIVFEPFYENYGPDAHPGGRRATVRDAARARTGTSTRTSCAPRSGRGRAASWSSTPAQPHRQGVHARGAGAASPSCASSTTSSCFTDEIYEHILYDGRSTCPWPRCPAWPSGR